jgi:hypothetical protein
MTRVSFPITPEIEATYVVPESWTVWTYYGSLFSRQPSGRIERLIDGWWSWVFTETVPVETRAA